LISQSRGLGDVYKRQFDMQIKEGVIEAKVYGIDFNEAVERLNEYLETCK
jgi:hypothetical protein